MPRRYLILILLMFVVAAFAALPVRAEKGIALKFDRRELELKWRARVQSFIDKGTIPFIDLESSLKRQDGEKYLDEALSVMDELGFALIAFDGYQKGGKKKKGYAWGHYINELVSAYPDRFILATNGGTNPDWLGGRDAYISQLEKQVRTGDYPIIGELDFRHYMSKSQCRKGRTDRDSDIPLNGGNGRRLFRLSAKTGVAFSIHLEAEDRVIDELEEMLEAYPEAKVIWSHFGQIRYPEREKRFGPDLVRRLLTTYPNLYYDISTGRPGRRYKCNDNVLDTVIWQADGGGGQKDDLKPEYKSILTEFSSRFVAATDYGGGRAPLPEYLKKKARNLRLILRDLPEKAKRDIGYRNAWKILTGKDWK